MSENVQTFSGKVNVADNLLVGTSHFFVDRQNNRVGIGTSTPDASSMLDVTGNIKSGGTITATGGFSGNGSGLSGVNSDSGSWVNGTNSNVHLATLTDKVGIGTHSPGAELHVAGTGAIVVPSGTTEQRPGTEVNGMLRYNSTTGYMEAYTVSGWGSIATPPTITGISPLSTFSSGGATFGWNKRQDLIHSTALADDYFGGVIGMSSDGNYAAISATGDAGAGTNSGTVTMFKRNTATNQWTQIQHENIPSGAATDDKFGSAISLSSDGQALVIAAGFAQRGGQDQAGMVSTWRFNGSTYSYVSELTNPRGNISGAVWGGVDTKRGTSMAGNGLNMVVGQYNYNSYRGIVDVYSRAAITNNWIYWATIAPPSTVGGVVRQYFGYTVEMSLDGKVVVIGANLTTNTVNREGLVYVYEYSGSADGVYSGGSWTLRTTLISPSPVNDGNFGSSVGISQDANYIIVGEPRAPVAPALNGNAYIYVRSGNSWAFQQTLVDPDSSAGDMLGISAALRLSSDGTYAILGVRRDTGEGDLGADTGKVLYFKRTNATWAYVQTIYHHSPTLEDNFGGASSVQISGDGTRALIGAQLDDTPYNNSGHAFYYDFSDTTITDASTQVFTVTGAFFDDQTTLQLQGADNTLYDVTDFVFTNSGSIGFKMGTLASGQAANRPFKIVVTNGAGLSLTSTATIGFTPIWTSPAAGATLANFVTSASMNNTELAATDGVGGSAVTFSVPASNLPSGLSLNGSTGAITGTIGALGTTSVTFRVTDNVSGSTADRTFNIVGSTSIYTFSSHTFTPGFTTIQNTNHSWLGPTLTQLTDAYTPAWTDNTNYLNVPTRGYQLWTVPQNGTYRIVVTGATGGIYQGMTAAQNLAHRGFGGVIQGDITLTLNQKLLIAVGQAPREDDANWEQNILIANSGWRAGAGGGGSFVTLGTTKENAVPILIAGGGGGSGNNSNQYRHGGWIYQTGSTSTTFNSTATTRGGNGGGAGGGFTLDGQALHVGGGQSFRSGLQGGQIPSSFGSFGAFGGGASGGGNPGGGGGGASGGDSGTGAQAYTGSTYNVTGDGGTSFAATDVVSNISRYNGTGDGNGSGHGSVVITLL